MKRSMVGGSFFYYKIGVQRRDKGWIMKIYRKTLKNVVTGQIDTVLGGRVYGRELSEHKKQRLAKRAMMMEVQSF